jgi:hypothetical protein
MGLSLLYLKREALQWGPFLVEEKRETERVSERGGVLSAWVNELTPFLCVDVLLTRLRPLRWFL